MSNRIIELETPSQTAERCNAAGAEWYGDKIEFAVPNRVHSRTLVRAIFAAHGCGDMLPAEPRDDSLLKRASREGRNPKGYICRPFVSPNKDTPMAILVAKVDGTDESGDEFTCLARVRIAYRIDPTSGATEPFATAKPPQGQTEYTDLVARDRAIWIAARTNELMHQAHNKDIGLWTRAAMTGIGAVQSVGGGNNFYAPRMLCERIHTLLSDLTGRQILGHYVRDPKTSLGAKHDKGVMAHSAERSLTREIEDMRAELQDAVARAGEKRKRTVYLHGAQTKLRELQNKMALYKAIIEEDLLAPLVATTELYHQHFGTILDGGVPDWADAAAPAAEESIPAPAAEEEGEGEDEGEVLAASATDTEAWWS